MMNGNRTESMMSRVLERIEESRLSIMASTTLTEEGDHDNRDAE
jgi:hypothetical protein